MRMPLVRFIGAMGTCSNCSTWSTIDDITACNSLSQRPKTKLDQIESIHSSLKIIPLEFSGVSW